MSKTLSWRHTLCGANFYLFQRIIKISRRGAIIEQFADAVGPALAESVGSDIRFVRDGTNWAMVIGDPPVVGGRPGGMRFSPRRIGSPEGQHFNNDRPGIIIFAVAAM